MLAASDIDFPILDEGAESAAVAASRFPGLILARPELISVQQVAIAGRARRSAFRIA
jgi:hypothetical protein